MLASRARGIRNGASDTKRWMGSGGRLNRKRERAPGARRPPAAGHSALVLAAPPALRHPAFIAVTLVAAACVAYSVSFALYDTDMWQHLAVGRAIWTLKTIPTRQLWTW